MTISSTTNKVVYNGLIGQSVFAYNYLVNDAEDMSVYLAGLVISDSNWTIDGLGEDAGGNVTLNTPLAADQTVTLLRDVAETQLVDYQPFDAFPAETHESALDKLTMLVQQVQEQVERSPIPPPDSQPGEGEYLVDGDLYANNAYMSEGAFAVDPPVGGTALTNLDYVNSRFSAFQTAVCTGMIAPFCFTPTDPAWLRCNGGAHSRTTHAVLFALIGTYYGVGDGSTTFNVPDYRGQFLRDQDEGAGVDPDAAGRTGGGDIIGSTQGSETGPHDHPMPHVHPTDGGGFALARGADGDPIDILNQAGDTGQPSTPNTSNHDGSESRPINIYVQHFVYSGIADA